MQLKLLSHHILTPDVRSYSFVVDSDSPGAAFPFEAGQFVMLKQPEAEKKYARAFSFACAPTAHEITFLMKHNPDGHISGYLAQSEPGTKIDVSKPMGRFILNPADTDRVYIATGTGIAPIISFIESNSSVPATILFGVRTNSDLFWQEKLPANSLITLTQPTEEWSGCVGRVTAYVPDLLSKHPNAAWYICGNPEMVMEVRAQLLSAGAAPLNIHFEIY